MRNLLLQAGQHVLYWLWIAAWPIWTWRWTRRAYLSSRKDAWKIRAAGLLPLGLAAILLATKDAWLVEIAITVYLPVGLKMQNLIHEFVHKHQQTASLTPPDSSKNK